MDNEKTYESLMREKARIAFELKALAGVKHKVDGKAGKLQALPASRLGDIAERFYNLSARGFPLPQKMRYVDRALRSRVERGDTNFTDFMAKSLHGNGACAIAIYEYMNNTEAFLPIEPDRATSSAPLNAKLFSL